MCTPDLRHVVLTLYVSPTAPRRAASTQVRMGTGSSGAVSANVCCDGWLRTNFHFTYCHNGTLPCQFLPPPEGWQHAHAQGGDQNVLLAEEEPEAELKELEASTQIFAAPSGDKRVFESCAVVSSSPSMLDSQYGEAIDAHSAVIRFNMAKTAGYEADVGSRTTLMVVNDVVANHPSIWIKNCKVRREQDPHRSCACACLTPFSTAPKSLAAATRRTMKWAFGSSTTT